VAATIKKKSSRLKSSLGYKAFCNAESLHFLVEIDRICAVMENKRKCLHFMEIGGILTK